VSAVSFTLMAIHGNGGGGFRFARMEPFIPAAVHFQAITLPGFANSPADPRLQTVADYAAHIQRLVQQQPAPVILLGTGIGGSIILEYLQQFAGSIAGVILHAPVGTRLDERRFPWLMSLPGAKPFGQWLFSTPLMRPVWQRLFFMDYQAIPADYLRQFFDEYRQCRVFGQMFEIITAAWYQRLQPVPIPAALLWGERERVLKVEHVQDYQLLLPNAQVRIVPGWDHFPMIEQPQAYTEEVLTLARNLLTQQAPRS
jgi:pimeloyl-ACP methyl ester carboxylesterase